MSDASASPKREAASFLRDRCGEKIPIADLESVSIWPVSGPGREVNLGTVDLLQPNDQHRSVRLGQDCWPDFDSIVGTHRKEEAVESGMVELAEC